MHVKICKNFIFLVTTNNLVNILIEGTTRIISPCKCNHQITDPKDILCYNSCQINLIHQIWKTILIGNEGSKISKFYFKTIIKPSSTYEVKIFHGSNSWRKIVECLEHVAAKNTLKYSLLTKDLYFRYIWQFSMYGRFQTYNSVFAHIYHSKLIKEWKILNYMSKKTCFELG